MDSRLIPKSVEMTPSKSDLRVRAGLGNDLGGSELACGRVLVLSEAWIFGWFLVTGQLSKLCFFGYMSQIEPVWVTIWYSLKVETEISKILAMRHKLR